ncbi:hypothetical protein [Nocardioides sp. Leaf307]|uniref:hypothetical protein n=1 Tax=Nocardioides sp. Leaf307 TaxID=1736331 RepID=UPI000702F928|nr:hypothetical protein [Nocardioides sp. Leaf307]KQQ39678.1 hypothetical protein ASF50_17560 [Nocardioides sp. Leaf307]
MRITRLVAGLASLLLALSISLVFTSPSTAAPAPAKEARTIELKGDQDGQKFFIKGRITPGSGPIKYIVERKVCQRNTNCKNSYKTWAKAKTNDAGRYTKRVYGPQGGAQRVYYRVKVRATERYKAAVSPNAIYIYKL